MSFAEGKRAKGFYWSASANQFAAKIGYHFTANATRTRTTHYLGRIERAAAALVAEKLAAREHTKRIWPEIIRPLTATALLPSSS